MRSMCEFCENPTKWNTDDYSLVPNRNLSDGIMQAEDNTYQIGVFNSYFDFFSVNYKRIVFIRAKFAHASHSSFALNSVSGNGMPKKCIFAYFLNVGTLMPAIFAASACEHLPYAYSINPSRNETIFRVLTPFAIFTPPFSTL